MIYEDLPAPKRERLHLRAAAALRERPAFAPVFTTSFRLADCGTHPVLQSSHFAWAAKTV